MGQLQMSKLLAVCLLLCVSAAYAANHAVLVAGSNGFWNYRHQADVCHAYQILIAKGVPAENIIVFAYDDIANNPQNPFPGKIYNKPDPTGPGVDVYAGCKIDYKGNDVTPANFLKVLKGESMSVGTGRTLKSTKDDKVFINFSDHGATGLIAFPSEYLYAKDLIATFHEMQNKNMYKQLVFYLEACESGSMFDGLMDGLNGIYATSAANPYESSYGAYCGGEAVVNGRNIGSCLGDLYSINWMEDADKNDMTKETIAEQFAVVQRLTGNSHVMQYGDLSVSKELVSEFLGSAKRSFRLTSNSYNKLAADSTLVNSRDAKLQYLYHAYTSGSNFAQDALMEELSHRKFVDAAFEKMAALQFPTIGLKSMDKALPPRNFDCLKAAVPAVEQACGKFSDYSLKYVRLVSNMCESNVDSASIASLAQRACAVHI